MEGGEVSKGVNSLDTMIPIPRVEILRLYLYAANTFTSKLDNSIKLI